MGGIDPAVITHKLNTNPSFKPVKQKRRSFAPERQKAINEEVGKLLQAGAIREVEYPEWLANVVLVKKANGKWRLCIDFTDINKACPKDSFPLPRIDLIVDATAGHELLSFMDAFSGYNQISMDPIWDYINDGTLPDDPKEAAKIRVRSSRFTNHKGSLYKQGFFTPFLKCITGEDTEFVLREVHEGICGNHIGARTLAGKVLRQGYYWPIILKDATDLVKKCRICQEHAKISRLPSEPLTSITSPWPFQQWGVDILGPLPIGKGQCKFIIVAVDYFTKWAEAEPLATITE